MVISLPAIYEHGILRPLEPLVLPEASQVRVQILNGETDEQEAAYQRALGELQRFLLTVEQNWANPLVQQVFVQRIETNLRALWRLADPDVRELCGMLVMASVQVQPEQTPQAQLQAFLVGVGLLEKASLDKYPLTDNDLDRCYDQLTLAGLPPSLSLPEKVVQSYLDEL